MDPMPTLPEAEPFMKRTISNIILVAALFSLLSACASAPAAAPPPAPDRGKELGRQFMVEVRKQYRFVKDQEVVDAVNAIGRRIVIAAGADPDAFHFFVVRENSPNAFAIPGGYIFVFDGLLARLKSEDELAGVLAHEVAHVTHNHFFKDENKSLALNLATVAAILLSRGQAAAANIAIAADISAQLHFSRENEEEADASALPTLKRAGYDPRGLLNFLQGLSGHENINRTDMPAYLSTHPALQSRIQMVELRMDRPVDGALAAPRAPLDWDRVQVMIRAKSRPWQEVAQLFPERIPGTPLGSRDRYLEGVAYLAADRVTDAMAAFQAAQEEDPENPLIQADLATAYLKAQDVTRARSTAMESLKRSRPGREPASAYLVLGMLDEHAGDFPGALRNYEKVIERDPDHAFAQFHAGQVYFQTGDALEGSYHTGRYLRLSLQPEAALREFKKALALAPKDQELARRIQSEIDQIQADGV